MNDEDYDSGYSDGYDAALRDDADPIALWQPAAIAFACLAVGFLMGWWAHA
jgi:hypothetical protein